MKNAFIILTVIVIGFLIAVLTRPDSFRVSRSVVMSAPASAIFPHVNTLRQWERWSPWAKMDPEAKSAFEGPAAGLGAKMSWAGPKSGEGTMTIVESRPNELVRFQLDFLKPFKATNEAEFTFHAQGPQTLVTWSMSGKNNFIAKAMSLFMDCDKMIGGEFEKGLRDLRTIAETPVAKK
jgi:hypothetical protein